MSEWFKEPVLKTGDSQEPWVRIPLSPPYVNSIIFMFFDLRKYPRGRRGSPAKGVGGESRARVQIPPSAPKGGNNSDILSATLRIPKGCHLFYFKFCVQKKRYFRVILVTGKIRTLPFAVSRAEFKEAPFLKALNRAILPQNFIRSFRRLFVGFVEAIR